MPRLLIVLILALSFVAAVGFGFILGLRTQLPIASSEGVSPRSGAASAAAARPDDAERCGIAGLPGDFGVVVISVSEGSTPVDVLLEKTGRAVTRQDVVVGATVKPVVLVLMAEEPVVWNVGRTPDGRIAGVLAQGAFRQAVVGLPNSTRVVTYASSKRPLDCPTFWAEGAQGTDYDNVRSRIRALFGREIAAFLNQDVNGRFVVGNVAGAIEHSGDATLASVALPADVVPMGQRGLDRLAREGSIRLARAQELDAWLEGAARRQGVPPAQYRDRMSWRTHAGTVYTVLKPVDLPGGLFGGDSRTFIVPAGVAMPGGPRDHSTFLQMDRFQCYGPGCR